MARCPSCWGSGATTRYFAPGYKLRRRSQSWGVDTVFPCSGRPARFTSNGLCQSVCAEAAPYGTPPPQGRNFLETGCSMRGGIGLRTFESLQFQY